MGLSCAWQSAICRSVSCPLGVNRSRSSWRIAPCAAARPSRGPRPVTTAAAAATCRNSRREIIGLSLVHRAVGRHDVGDQVLDLVETEEAAGAEAGHVRARDGGVGVVDPLVDGLHVSFRVLAGLAVSEQAGAQGAEAQLLLVELVAGVAVTAVLLARRVVGEAPPVAALRQLLALPPVTRQLPIGRVLDGGLLAGQDRICDVVGWRIALLAAQLLRLVLHEPLAPFGRGPRPAALDRGLDGGRAVLGLRRGGGKAGRTQGDD